MKDINTVKIRVYDTHLHYYVNDRYLGMLVFKKGELSDFRAIVRKNRITINRDNLFKVIRVSLFELLNHFLEEEILIDKKNIQELKTIIVKNNEFELENVYNTIISKGMI